MSLQPPARNAAANIVYTPIDHTSTRYSRNMWEKKNPCTINTNINSTIQQWNLNLHLPRAPERVSRGAPRIRDERTALGARWNTEHVVPVTMYVAMAVAIFIRGIMERNVSLSTRYMSSRDLTPEGARSKTAPTHVSAGKLP